MFSVRFAQGHLASLPSSQRFMFVQVNMTALATREPVNIIQTLFSYMLVASSWEIAHV